MAPVKVNRSCSAGVAIVPLATVMRGNGKVLIRTLPADGPAKSAWEVSAGKRAKRNANKCLMLIEKGLIMVLLGNAVENILIMMAKQLSATITTAQRESQFKTRAGNLDFF